MPTHQLFNALILDSVWHIKASFVQLSHFSPALELSFTSAEAEWDTGAPPRFGDFIPTNTLAAALATVQRVWMGTR